MSALLATSLAACAGDKPKNLGTAFKSEPLAKMLDSVDDKRLNDKFIRAGVKAIEDGDYVAASKSFSRALKFDRVRPVNPLYRRRGDLADSVH